VSDRKERTRAFVAWLKGRPVGATELFLGLECAGLHSLSVQEEYQGRGIGSALIEHVCNQAIAERVGKIVLLASTEGQRVYAQRGFVEVARFGYWYRSFQRSR